MKYYDGTIDGYENDELLDIIQNLPPLNHISLILPENLDRRLSDEIIGSLNEPMAQLSNIGNEDGEIKGIKESLIKQLKEKGYDNNYSLKQNTVVIQGWDHIKRVLQHCKKQIYYFKSEINEQWEDLISHIIHELLLIGLPYKGVVHVPKVKRDPNSSIINEPYFVGPDIPFNKRSEDFSTPIVNYTIELPDGRVCGFDPVGVHYLEYLVFDNKIFIDDAVIEELGIKSGDIINFRLFIFPRNLYPILIKSPNGDINEVTPLGQYHG